jgi:hypothetical protein
LHQVYACKGQLAQAADLALAVGDLHSAFAYFAQTPGLESARASLDIAKTILDPKLIAQANGMVAEALCALAAC